MIAFVVGSSLSAVQVYLDYDEQGDLLARDVRESQMAFRPAAARAVFLLDSDLAREVVEGFMEYNYVAKAAIMDDSGAELAVRERDTVALNPELKHVRYVIPEMDEYRFTLDLPGSVSNSGGALILVVDRAVGLSSFIDRASTVFFSGLLRNFLLALLLYAAFHRVVSRPLRSIVGQISAIDPEQPGEMRIQISEQDKSSEFGLLARQINQSFDAVQILLDNLRSTNRALTSSEESLRLRSWELEQEVERAKRTSLELISTKEKAEAANRAKSVFLANVSHELRTPLNAIIGFSSIMTEEMFGPVGQDKYRQYIRDIRDSSQHLSEILGEVLDLAKIEAAELKIEEEAIDVVGLCAESTTLIGSQAAQKMVRLSFEPPQRFPRLYGDRLRIKQSVLNLLSNAVKFTSGGTVTIALDLDEDDGHMVIAVQDTGIGIAEDEQNLIFAPFIRSSEPLSRSHEGTGLGLALVKAFVEVHGGWVTLESEIDKGSCFTMHFPTERILQDGETQPQVEVTQVDILSTS